MPCRRTGDGELEESHPHPLASGWGGLVVVVVVIVVVVSQEGLLQATLHVKAPGTLTHLATSTASGQAPS